jgi:peptide/nickel transport system substrate-binding protein
MLRIRTISAWTLVSAGLLAISALSTAVAQQKGGIVNWFVYADPGRLDVHTESPLGVQQATAGVWSGLLQYSPDDPSKIVPDLAVSYESSNGDKTYTFKLREGVKWHDGQPFTAQDVKATYDRLLDPNVKARRCGSLMRPILDSVTVKGEHSVQFDLKFAAATFIPSAASAWCRVAAKHVLAKYGDLQGPEAQIGTGPFKFKRYVRGSVIEWERNPDYYNPKLPYLDGVKQFVLKGAARQLAAAKAGQLHVWDTWPPMSKSAADELKSARGDEVELFTWPINTLWAVHLNVQKEPFDKKDIRRAVHLALNRPALFQKAFEGAGTPCSILDPNLYGDWALPQDEVMKTPGCRADKTADLAEAKKLVQKHYPNGFDFEIVTRTVGNYVDRIQLVAADLKKIGLRGTIKTYESAAGYSVYGKGDFQAIGTQDTAMFIPDPSIVFSILYVEKAGRNWVKWNDAKINKWADQALRETDQAKRRALYHDMQRYLLTEDSPAVVVGWIEGWFFTDKKMKNYRRANTIYDNNTFMNVWLEQ